MIKNIESKEQFLELIDGDNQLAVLFTIDGCPYCHRATKLFEDLDQLRSAGYSLYVFDVTHEEDVRQMYMLIEFPTVVFLYGSLIEKLSVGMGMIHRDCNFVSPNGGVISNGKTK